MKANRNMRHSLSPRRPVRRGVLLLLILALLAMFGLISIAFVVISGQAQRSAKSVERIDLVSDPPQKTLHQAAMQVFRGPTSNASAMRAHSLLDDIYGNWCQTGTFQQAPTRVCGNQLIEATTACSGLTVADAARRGGCVLTINSVPAGSTVSQFALVGQSTRIVSVNPTTGTFQANAFPNNELPPQNATFTINGTPFSGPGFGYNSATGLMDLAYDPADGTLKTDTTPSTLWPVALLPNLPLNRYTAAFPFVGANSDYTAADFQHILLAAQVPNGVNPPHTLPSLHRPSLVNYWYQQLFANAAWPGAMSADDKWQAILNPYGDKSKTNVFIAGKLDTAVNPCSDATVTESIVTLRRLMTLRPLPEDHPNFTGSNSYARRYQINTGTVQFAWERDADNNGEWDVDNDGDGRPDSIWVDLGMPVRATADGRLYKPLFAILCLDLDGRLNLNAHGTLVQADAGGCHYGNVAADGRATGQQFCYADTAAAKAYQKALPRGQGFGPADINLRPLFPTLTQYEQLLKGTATLDGRYGGYDKKIAGTNISGMVPGWDPIVKLDYLGLNKLYDYPNNYIDVAQATAYGDLADLKGTVAIGLDPRGQPLYQDSNIPASTSFQTVLLPDPNITGSAANPYLGAKSNTPYDLDLSPRAVRGQISPSTVADNPFSPTELERVLRPYDKDAASLPGRLAALAPALLPAPTGLDQRRNATTESWDVPSPNLAMPEYLVTQGKADLANAAVKDWILTWLSPRHPSDILLAKYYYEQRHTGAGATDASVAMANAKTYFANNAAGLLSPDLFAGLRMNVNRPFVVPNPAVALYETESTTGKYSGAFSFNPAGGAMTSIEARQQYAKQLYCLMLTLQEPGSYAQVFQETALTTAEKEELTKRRIAQWAINVACFQTNDSVMVPFEYDIDPFTTAGWRVDGIIGGAPSDDLQAYRRLVWATKAPELLLTETIAFHDRRVADTSFDGSGNKKRTDPDSNTPVGPADLTMDQPRIPQGSAFFELYCPRNASNGTAPSDLYTYDSTINKWCLDLGRLAPADGNGRQYPVWRMVISETANAPNNADVRNDVLTRFANNPDTFVPESQQYHGQPNTGDASLLPLATPVNLVAIDRIVWFTSQAPVSGATGHRDYDRIYYNRTGPVALTGGTYCVVAPRARTYIGTKDAATNGNKLGDPSPQNIALTPTSVSWTGSDASSAAYPSSNEIKPACGMVVAGGVPPTGAATTPPSWPAGWANASLAAPNGFGISVSEPLFSASYYAEPDEVNPSTTETDAYGDLTQVNSAKPFLSTPQDTNAGKPLYDDQLLTTGTRQNYKTVLLQRLANPLAAFDPVANPYRTVDWMPIDLTVFNGEDNPPNKATLPAFLAGQWDPDDANWDRATKPLFAARERGEPTKNFNLWTQLSQPRTPAEVIKTGATNINFDYDLAHTAGYINKPFWDAGGTWLTSATAPAVPVQYYGDPSQPFPWPTWNNRPFVSQWELMLVPASYPGRLLWEYATQFGPPNAKTNPAAVPFKPDTSATPPMPAMEYSCLLNFFWTENVAGTPPTIAPRFHRLFDYVNVPSRFLGTDTQVDPTDAAAAAGHNFHPPFNRISTYREPGRINLNTIYSEDVWKGLMNYFPDNNPASGGWRWTEFMRSRQGYAGTSILDMNNGLPTQFARPFRSCGGTTMVPACMLQPATTRELDASLLRSDAVALTASTNQPLLQFDSTTATTAPTDVNNPDRNPFFRYQAMQRLGNLVTTRSNVYAVWITVGYFEVTPVASQFAMPNQRKHADTTDWTAADYQAVYPDGYVLGQELGLDTGEVQRHRAFYMFDRTIPVGFQRGQDLNVEKAILLNRFIE